MKMVQTKTSDVVLCRGTDRPRRGQISKVGGTPRHSRLLATSNNPEGVIYFSPSGRIDVRIKHEYPGAPARPARPNFMAHSRSFGRYAQRAGCPRLNYLSPPAFFVLCIGRAGPSGNLGVTILEYTTFICHPTLKS